MRYLLPTLSHRTFLAFLPAFLSAWRGVLSTDGVSLAGDRHLYYRKPLGVSLYSISECLVARSLRGTELALALNFSMRVMSVLVEFRWRVPRLEVQRKGTGQSAMVSREVSGAALFLPLLTSRCCVS